MDQRLADEAWLDCLLAGERTTNKTRTQEEDVDAAFNACSLLWSSKYTRPDTLVWMVGLKQMLL